MRGKLAICLLTLGTAILLARTAGADPSFQFTSIDFPGATLTRATGINSKGQIVGRYVTGGAFHGFLLSRGTYTSIDVPAASYTIAHGINDAGQIVGRYGDARGVHGFLLSDGAFTTINFPSAVYTALAQINNRGDIAGTYIDAGGTQHGFSLTEDSFRSN